MHSCNHLKFKRCLSTRHYGFTLAEILVVITIIGVIASLTIPDLIQSTQDTALKSAWKKIYAELSDATLQIKENNGGTMIGFSRGYGYFKNVYANYLSVVKNCDSVDMSCWHPDGDWVDMRGIPQTGAYANGVILSNGAMVTIVGGELWPDNDECTLNSFAIEECGFLYVDVNGFKGPNTIGKDIFGAHITKDALVPWGAQNDAFSTLSLCNTDPPDNPWWSRGWACSTTYLTQ